MSHTETKVENDVKEAVKEHSPANTTEVKDPSVATKTGCPFKHAAANIDEINDSVKNLNVNENKHIKITDEQIKELEAEFKKSDTNNDNKLSRKEYYIMLKIDGDNLREKHLKSFFFAIEPDTNGSVSFSELVALMNDVKNGHDEKLKELLLQNLFKHYDKNHDGTISFKEFKRIVHDFDVSYGEKVKDLYDQIDGDHDQKITKEELGKHLDILFGL